MMLVIVVRGSCDDNKLGGLVCCIFVGGGVEIQSALTLACLLEEALDLIILKGD